MSVDALRHSAMPAAEPAEISYLDSARTRYELPERPSDELDQLHALLRTERSAAAAMLESVLELERRLEAERAELRRQRLENERQWDEIHQLTCQLYQAEQPRWRRLLTR